jgi:RHS repeat-associated protein
MSANPSVISPRTISKAARLGIFLFILAAVCLPASATIVYTFEDLPDAYFYSSGDENIGTYYSGIAFGPDVTGLSVSRFGGYDSSGFPPESGDVVIWDATDATITISFATPLDFFGIWYTTYDPLTLEAFDSADNLLDTAVGTPNTDGTTGTNTFLSLSDAGISSVTLTSTPGYFTLDDMTIDTGGSSVPEPSSGWLLGGALLLLAGQRSQVVKRVARAASRNHSASGLVALSLLTGSVASAQVYQATLSNVNFLNGFPTSGSFVFNASTGAITGSAVTFGSSGGYTAALTDAQNSAIIVHTTPVQFVEIVLVAQAPTGTCSLGSQCGSTYVSLTILGTLATLNSPGTYNLICGYCDNNPSENADTSSETISSLNPPIYSGSTLATRGQIILQNFGTTANLGPPGPTNPTAFTSEPINTATGNYYATTVDFSAPSKGQPFRFARTYNSLSNYSGPFGANWTHSFNVFLSANSSTGVVTVNEAEGSQDVFNPAGSGAFTGATPGLFDVLAQNGDGSYTLTRKNQTVFQFSAAGTLTSIVDRNGNTQSLAYGTSGNLTSITDASGRALTLAYNASGQIASLSDPISRLWQYAYDANGNLILVTDPSGGVTQYTYDASHRMTSATDARGVTYMQNTFDSLGRVVTQTNARSFTTSLAYNTPSAGTTTVTDPLGNATQDVYDGLLRLSQIVDAKGDTISYTYDANNDRTSATNPNGYTTNFSYDGRGNTLGITDPLGNTQSFTYDAQNDLLTATNPKGATTTFIYDSKGNLLTIKDALSDTTSFTYTSAGQVATKTDARADVTSYAYDSSGNLITATNALGNATAFSYDGIGRLLTTTDANSHTSNVTYDALSRITKTTDALGNATQFAYDAIGNLLTTTDANGKAATSAYDGTNNLTTVTDAASGVTTYGYDANNNRTSFRNAKGNTTTYTFDALNQLASIADPLGNATSYKYDAVGNTASTTDSNASTNRYTYDALNRLVGGSFADGSSVSYGYDKDGNRTSMTDWRGATTYTYDALDRVLSVTSPAASVVQYSYDAVGNRSSLGYPDGRTVQYQFDALNRLAQVTDWASKSTHYSYDKVGNLAGFAYPNGAASTYSYDAANRLLQIVNNSGSLTLSSFTYGLDNVGNRLQVTSAASGTTKYGYDALYRLTSWTAPSGQVTQYNYDPVGNRASMVSSAGTTAYTYDAADRMLTAGTSSYTYDNNGNQITKTTGTTTVTYSYDPLNRLSAASGGGMNSQYKYDGDGNRVTQIVPAGTYQYLNDTAVGLPVVLNENGPDGNIDYLHGRSLISETSSAFQYFYQTDGIGSAASLTDATGTLKASYAYDPWGKLTTPIDPLGTKNKYKFTREPLDPGTALYYLRARAYDPGVGRFTRRDQLPGVVSFPQDLNRYQYANNNPVRLVDPSGLSAIDTESSGQNGTAMTLLAGPIFNLSSIAPAPVPGFAAASANLLLDAVLLPFDVLSTGIGLSRQIYGLITAPPSTPLQLAGQGVELYQNVSKPVVSIAIDFASLLLVPGIAQDR